MSGERLKIFFRRYGHIIWFAACIFVVLALCSECSFLYPFNDWTDANCFFTVGKSLSAGKVLYRDIYEQKGLYLYVLHTLAYFVSDDTFIGVWLFELVAAAILTFALYRILLLYVDKTLATVLVPVLLVLTYASRSFCHGDSAEEFIMPLMALSLLFLLKRARGEVTQALSYAHCALSGTFAAFAFWIKFTLCGFFFGWIVLVFAFGLADRDIKRAFLEAAVFVAAVIVASLPSIIYFAANNALGDLWQAYFYNNLFVYSGENEAFLTKVGKFFWAYGTSFWYGLLFYVSVFPGLVFTIFSKGYTRREKIAIFTVYLLTNVFIYAGGRRSRYYGLPLSIFAFTGLAALCKIKPIGKAARKMSLKITSVICALVSLAGVGFIFVYSNNIPMMFTDRQDLMQYSFAEIISKTPDATFLNYGSLDSGVYTTTNIVPTCKYFCGLNIRLEELTRTQDYYVENGLIDFVLCRGELPEEISARYTVAAIKEQEYEGDIIEYYLYELNK